MFVYLSGCLIPSCIFLSLYLVSIESIFYGQLSLLHQMMEKMINCVDKSAFYQKKKKVSVNQALTIFLDIEEEWNCDLETAVNYKPSLSTRKTVAPPRHAPSNL